MGSERRQLGTVQAIRRMGAPNPETVQADAELHEVEALRSPSSEFVGASIEQGLLAR